MLPTASLGPPPRRRHRQRGASCRALAAGLLLLALPPWWPGAARAAGAGTHAPPGRRVTLERVVAVVDDEVVLLSEMPDLSADPHAWGAAIDARVDGRLVERALAKQRSLLGVSEREVDRAVDEIRASHHLSSPQLDEALRQHGLDLTSYRRRLRDQLEQARLLQARLLGQPRATDQQVVQRCLAAAGAGGAKVCAAHILFAVPVGGPAPAEAKARGRGERALAELAGGAGFAELARRASDDTATGDGSLGCFGRGEMLEPFEQAAFALAAGEHSGLVRTQVGYHIIQVDERPPPDSGPCAQPEALEQARQALLAEQLEHEREVWLEELRAAASIDRRP